MAKHLRTKGSGERNRQTPEEWRSSPLWRSLLGMRIESEGAALGFVVRLRRENGWSPAYAEAVFAEYLRFLFLAVRSSHPVTPSDDVDHAWHLHLTYTRHYWDILCDRILGHPLHHDPTLGGAAEAAHYRCQYEATLWLYGETFGAPPPADIWPDAGTRFAARPQWVDRSRYWLIPKALLGRGGALASATTLLASCTMLAANKGSASSLTAGLAVLAILVMFVGLLAVAKLSGWKKDIFGGSCGGGGGHSGSSGGDCNGCGGGGCGGGCGG